MAGDGVASGRRGVGYGGGGDYADETQIIRHCFAEHVRPFVIAFDVFSKNL